MTRFTERQGADLMRGAMEVLKQYAADNNVTISPSTRFSYGAMLEFKVVFNPIAADGTSLTKEQKDYDRQVRMSSFELPPRGTQFKGSNGGMFTIYGWNSRARKWPIMATENSTGKPWRFTERHVSSIAKLDKPKPAAPATPLIITPIVSE